MTVPLIDLLRADLASANYSVTALTGLWGVEADAALHRNQRVPAVRALTALRHKLGRPERSATLAQLFVLGLPVSRVDLDAALPTLGSVGAADLGLVTDAPAGPDSSTSRDAGTSPDAGAGPDAGTSPEASTSDPATDMLQPLLDLRPYSFIDSLGAGSWWIASDLGELALGHALGENHVLGVGGASLTLAGLVLPNPVGSALDIGTGCGIQAMHAARHADRVVATDISERALELAALNAQLNGITNIEFRLGSLFEPVAGERFDHIISNPPFVITPRTEGVPSYEYRDGGLVGDAIVEAVVTGAAAHLTPGGVAQMLGNWEYRTDTDAFDRMTGWLDRPDAGALDAWIIEREVELPTEYAETWIRDGGTRPDTPDFDRLYGAWLDDFAARDVAKVGFGYMLLRAPAAGASASAAPFRRLERLHGSLGQNSSGLGAYLAECLAAHDWQAATDDDALSRAHLIVAPDVTEERHYWPGNDDPTLMTLHQGAGFGRTVPLDTALAALIGACDGDLSVGAIIGALSHLLDADERALTADLLPRLRELLDDGFLRVPTE